MKKWFAILAAVLFLLLLIVGILWLRNNHKKEMRIQSMTHMRHILTACSKYWVQNKFTWPDDLQTLVDHQILNIDVLRNPRDPVQGKYEYIKPKGEWKKATHTTAILYEELDPMPELVNVGFADFHVESLPLERAKQLIENAKSISNEVNAP